VTLNPDHPAPNNGAAGFGAVAASGVFGGARVMQDGSAAARVSAQVGGRRLEADALLYPHLEEEVLVIWAGGHSYEFR
jgi:hypothetical protein